MPATPNGVPQSHDAVWARYQAGSNTDAPGDVGAAVQWWLTGVYVPTNDEQYQRSSYGKATSSQLDAFNGYYYDDYLFSLAHKGCAKYAEANHQHHPNGITEKRHTDFLLECGTPAAFSWIISHWAVFARCTIPGLSAQKKCSGCSSRLHRDSGWQQRAFLPT